MIDWNEIDLKGKTTGQLKVKCPECIGDRSNKSDKSLSVNLDAGLAKCHYCEKIAIKDKEETEYIKPSQNWVNRSDLSDNLVKWVQEYRSISESTLKSLKITEEKFYQPSMGKEVNNIVFNYFEGDAIVNKKYRSSNKKFTQSKGGKSIFYNINSVIGQEEVIIVEGEFDVLAFYEIGFKNVISVPNGANDNDDYFKNSEKYLKHVERFIIATDNDAKGIELRDKISHRLGKWRCKFIEFENKDANGDLIAGVLTKTAYKRHSFPVGGTFTIDDVYDDVIDLYDNGLPDTISPQKKCFGNLKDVFSIYKGQLTVVTGIPSHGKSTFVDWYVLNLVNDYDFKASFYSPEHSPLSLYQRNFIQKFYGKKFFKKGEGERITKEEIEFYKKWASEKLYFLTNEKGKSNNWDWLMDKMKEHIYSFGTNLFVIDAFNKVLLPKNRNKKDGIDEVLTELTNFCVDHNVNVFLVAHPTKMKKNEKGNYDMPTLYDVSGSADFRNQTHNGFCIHRTFGEDEKVIFTNLKTKHSFQGRIGESINFKYHIPSMRYYPDYDAPYIGCLVDKEIKIDELTPNELFEHDDNIF